MKKFLCVLFAVVLVAAVFAGCNKGSSTVTTSVSAAYADDFAKDYASSVKTDENGNVTYEFTDEKYEEFLDAYHDQVAEESKSIVVAHENEDEKTVYGQYVDYNDDITRVLVGIMPDSYDEAACKEEAQKVGEIALKYQMNTKEPTGSVDVVYENCNTGEDYFTVTVTAE